MFIFTLQYPGKAEVKVTLSNILFLSSIQGQVVQMGTNIYVRTAIYKDKRNANHL